MNYDSFETIEEDNTLILTTNHIDINESSFSETFEHSVFTGGQMTGAEAELIALSEGTLSVDNNSNVSISNYAQRDMRVLHAVNAVSSIAANGLNVGKMSALAQGISQMSLQQQNQFVQQR
jgi:hypothetical protein